MLIVIKQANKQYINNKRDAFLSVAFKLIKSDGNLIESSIRSMPIKRIVRIMANKGERIICSFRAIGFNFNVDIPKIIRGIEKIPPNIDGKNIMAPNPPNPKEGNLINHKNKSIPIIPEIAKIISVIPNIVTPINLFFSIISPFLRFFAGDEACFEQRKREKYASAGPAKNHTESLINSFIFSLLYSSRKHRVKLPRAWE